MLSTKAVLNNHAWPLQEIFNVYNKASFERKVNEILASAAEFKTIDLTTATESDQLQWLAEFARLDIAFDTLESALKLANVQHEIWIDETKSGSVMAELEKVLASSTECFITWMEQCSASAGWPTWAVQLKLEFVSDDNSLAGSFCGKKYSPRHFIDQLKQIIKPSGDGCIPINLQKRCTKMGWNSGDQIARLLLSDKAANYHPYFSRYIINNKSDITDVRLAESKPWGDFKFNFDEAIGIIIACFKQLDSDLSTMIDQAIVQGRIKVSHSSLSNSFCMDTPVGSFISLQFNGGLSDLALLAHECGHLIHQQVIRNKFQLAQNVNEELSETIAIFFESWVVKYWGELTGNEIVATAWEHHRDIEWQGRHSMLANFELSLYQQEKFSVKELDRLWREVNHRFYGSSVTLNQNFSQQWLTLTHILHSPFYYLIYPSASLKAKRFMKEPMDVLSMLERF